MGTFNNEAIVQRGTITLSSVASNTATLSTEIDTTTAELRHTGERGAPTYDSGRHATLYLTNGTTVTAQRYDSGGVMYVNYEVTGVPV